MPWTRNARAAPIYRTARHRNARATLIAHYQPGDPCCLCGEPMWPPTRDLHADHCPTCQGDGCDNCNGSGYRGLAHGGPPNYCNQRDGARRGRARQDVTQLVW